MFIQMMRVLQMMVAFEPVLVSKVRVIIKGTFGC